MYLLCDSANCTCTDWCKALRQSRLTAGSAELSLSHQSSAFNYLQVTCDCARVIIAGWIMLHRTVWAVSQCVSCYSLLLQEFTTLYADLRSSKLRRNSLPILYSNSVIKILLISESARFLTVECGHLTNGAL